ncbi:hypothetical protein [Nocardioides ungokensis]|uniref:hypothetical protein n=1 Tax=Nocardioides ungokensis TaxID=1643322 RepID=UPI0015DE4D3F|nr:hypothetical protein [Nocardioides ungokensis]
MVETDLPAPTNRGRSQAAGRHLRSLTAHPPGWSASRIRAQFEQSPVPQVLWDVAAT